MTSPAILQAEAAARREDLRKSVSDLGHRLAPATLSQDVGSALTSRVSAVGQALGEKAATPIGVVALSAMAFSSAFAMTGALPRNRQELRALSPTPTRPVSPVAEAAPPRGDVALMLAQLSAAIAFGAVISRFVPTSETEHTILAGVGPELRKSFQDRITETAHRLVAPTDTPRYGLSNLLALGGALLLSRTKSRNS